MDETLLWEIRSFVYRHFADTTRSPSAEETASHFGLTDDEAVSAYEELQHRHALVLNPGTSNIRMANPFSGVETPFKVYANNKTYFANCAWDSLGIPAALQVDAVIEASCAQTDDLIRLRISDQQIQNSNALVHFLIPFKDWYDDLVFT
jgi:DNA-binding transcriptional MocR family regulator